MTLSRLYAIVDTGYTADPVETARALLSGGLRLLQYRHKSAFERRHFEDCSAIARLAKSAGAIFIVNDRVDVALMCDADGVHVGQTDLPPDAVRKLLGPGKIIGYSTHDREQARVADGLPVDYIAVGPVFATRTKQDADPEVGLAGVTAVRRVTTKPLVAIGGITRETAASVLAAGADSVAVVRDLLASPDVAVAAREFWS